MAATGEGSPPDGSDRDKELVGFIMYLLAQLRMLAFGCIKHWVFQRVDVEAKWDGRPASRKEGVEARGDGFTQQITGSLLGEPEVLIGMAIP